MPNILDRFAFLKWPLLPLKFHVSGVSPRSKLAQHLEKAEYSVRLLRYWWAGQALAQEAQRLGRPLRVIDLGCERGWLKHFTPPEAVSHWIGVDWNPRSEARTSAGYDEVHHANFDEQLPLESRNADAVVSLHVFEHLPRPGATLAEVSRLLKPGGIFLGGAPTMPGFLARWREKYFRRLLIQGQLVPGGHITCLSPGRWRKLAAEVGLDVEFAVGSHAVRMTGGFLENYRPWVRLNQLWGALFPALGSECYLRARRQAEWTYAPSPLPANQGRYRLLWATLAVTAIVMLTAAIAGAFLYLPWAQSHPEHCAVNGWMAAHQRGTDHFIVVSDDDIPAHILKRDDVTLVERIDDAHRELTRRRGAHILVENSDMTHLRQSELGRRLSIDSRLEVGNADYFLLREQSSFRTSLDHYLHGT